MAYPKHLHSQRHALETHDFFTKVWNANKRRPNDRVQISRGVSISRDGDDYLLGEDDDQTFLRIRPDHTIVVEANCQKSFFSGNGVTLSNAAHKMGVGLQLRTTPSKDSRATRRSAWVRMGLPGVTREEADAMPGHRAKYVLDNYVGWTHLVKGMTFRRGLSASRHFPVMQLLNWRKAFEAIDSTKQPTRDKSAMYDVRKQHQGFLRSLRVQWRLLGLDEPPVFVAPHPGYSPRRERERALERAPQCELLSWWRGGYMSGMTTTGPSRFRPNLDNVVLQAAEELRASGTVPEGTVHAIAMLVPPDCDVTRVLERVREVLYDAELPEPPRVSFDYLEIEPWPLFAPAPV